MFFFERPHVIQQVYDMKVKKKMKLKYCNLFVRVNDVSKEVACAREKQYKLYIINIRELVVGVRNFKSSWKH